MPMPPSHLSKSSSRFDLRARFRANFRVSFLISFRVSLCARRHAGFRINFGLCFLVNVRVSLRARLRAGGRRPGVQSAVPADQQRLEGRSAFEAFVECVQPGKGPALSTAAVASALLIASGQLSRKLACDFCQIPEGGARSRVGTLAKQMKQLVEARVLAALPRMAA